MRTLILVSALLAPVACSAAPTACKTIPDDHSRLACYDAQAAVKTAQPKPDKWAPAKAAMSRKLADPEGARWGDFWEVAGEAATGLVCGTVNPKNRMGGYNGVTGFTYERERDRAILLYSGETDPEAGTATRLWRAYCAADPRGAPLSP